MLPFTFILLALVVGAGIWSKTHDGVLTDDWIQKIGFAPNDLWVGRLERILFSTFFTDGRKSFVQALILILIFVGATEWAAGTVRAFLIFWMIHVVTLLIVSLLIVLPMHRLSISYGTELALARDVGPSAGYFGCFGFLICFIPLAWRWGAAGVIAAGLVFVFFLPPKTGENLFMKRHSDLAHLIAFLLGILSMGIK